MEETEGTELLFPENTNVISLPYLSSAVLLFGMELESLGPIPWAILRGQF